MNNNETPSSSDNMEPASFEDQTIQPSPRTDSHLDQTVAPSNRPNADPSASSVEGFGDYELIDEIARGGMGVVYRGHQKSLNRDVAIKMILAGQFASEDEVNRFYTEAEAAAKLDHPNIVPIFEVGQFEGNHYFSMKLIEGQHLGQRLKALRNDVAKAVDILTKVCDAVSHAHQRGILHRDLKPGNILLDQNDEPYVTDLGLARSVDGDSQLTRTGAVLGTPSYMPPEQASGSTDVTTAADIYSLGAILYEVLTGRPPFKAASPVETMMQVINELPERPSAAGNVDRDLELICLKCLEKEPDHRYPSADALAKDLRCWMNGEPISVRAPSVANVTRFWLKQNFGRAIWTLIIGPLAGMISVLCLWFSTVNNDFASLKRLYERFPSVDTSWIFWGFVETPAWAIVPCMIMFAASIVFIGFATALFVKPKNQGADVAAGFVVGISASLAAFIFGMGSLSVLSVLNRGDIQLTSNLANAPPSQASEILDMAYPELKGMPLEKQVDLLTTKIGMDYLHAVPRGLWYGFWISLSLYLIPCLFETIVAGPITRNEPRLWFAFCKYWERTFPIVILMTIFALIFATRLILGGIGLEPGIPVYLVVIAIVVALILWRLRCHWSLRLIGQLGLLVAFANFFAVDFQHTPHLARTKAEIAKLENRVERFPDNDLYRLHKVGAKTKYVDLLVTMGRFTKAEKISDQAIQLVDRLDGSQQLASGRIRRDRCTVRLQKALLLARSGRHEEAMEFFEKTRDQFAGLPILAQTYVRLNELAAEDSASQ